MNDLIDTTPSLSEILGRAARARIEFKNICASHDVHERLNKTLGDAWNMAVKCFGTAPNAAEYLLSPNQKYNNETPMDALMREVITVEYIQDDIGRIMHGVHA